MKFCRTITIVTADELSLGDGGSGKVILGVMVCSLYWLFHVRIHRSTYQLIHFKYV